MPTVSYCLYTLLGRPTACIFMSLLFLKCSGLCAVSAPLRICQYDKLNTPVKQKWWPINKSAHSSDFRSQCLSKIVANCKCGSSLRKCIKPEDTFFLITVSSDGKTRDVKVIKADKKSRIDSKLLTALILAIKRAKFERWSESAHETSTLRFSVQELCTSDAVGSKPTKI